MSSSSYWWKGRPEPRPLVARKDCWHENDSGIGIAACRRCADLASADQCGAAVLPTVTSCHIVPPVVRQLIVETGQCTVRPQNSMHHRHPNRNIQAGHHTQCDCEWCYYRPNGRTARKIIVVGVTLPGGTSSCCWCTAWLCFTLCEVMSVYHMCLPGTKQPVKRLAFRRTRRQFTGGRTPALWATE